MLATRNESDLAASNFMVLGHDSEAQMHAGLLDALGLEQGSVHRHRYDERQPAAFRGEVTAGAVFRHDLH